MTAIAGGQAPPTGTLSPDLRAHLKGERLGIVTSIRGLPLGVRQSLQMLWGSASLDIAEPGEEFQAAAASGTSKLPIRRLVSAGCANDQHCIVYYERGGGSRTWRVLLFQWTPDATRIEFAATAPGGLATIEDVRNTIVSGANIGKASVW